MARVSKLASQAGATARAAEAKLAKAAELRRGTAEAARREQEASIRERARVRWQEGVTRVDATVGELAEQPAAAAWAATAWRSEPVPGRPAPAVRVGSAHLVPPAGGVHPIDLAVLVHGAGAGHLLVRAPARCREQSVGLIEAALLRVLASQPPGHVRFRVHDPVGLGSSLGGFGSFETPRVSRGAPLTDASALRAELDELAAHANRISGEYLRGAYATLTDFLDDAGHGLVPFEVLVLLDYPTAIDQEAGERLSRLAATAGSRGIMLLVYQLSDSGPPAFQAGVTVIEADESMRWRCSTLPGAQFVPDERPPSSLIEWVARRKTPAPAALLFAKTIEHVQADSATSVEGLEVRVGVAGLQPVDVRLDDDVPHGLVAGDTGSGKSNFLRALIYGLVHRYPPSELQLYLLDFKEGVEFREFAASAGDPTFLPQARVVSVNSSRAFGVAVLEHLADLTTDRYRRLPDDAKKLSALRGRHPEEAWPRILLVVDEFHVLFESGDLLGQRAARALTVLGKQGRAAGVHFLLATQAIGDVAAGNANAAQVDGIFNAARLRIALRLDDRESQAILRMGNRAAAEIHQPGMAIINAMGGHEDGNVPTKVALLENSDASRIRREAVMRARSDRRPPRVFNGSEGADPGLNLELRAALARSNRAAGPSSWIGTKLELDPTDPRGYPGLEVDFTPDSHRHLAVVGAGAAGAVSALQWTAIGLGAHLRGGEFVLVDLLRPSDDAPEHAVRALFSTLQGLGSSVQLTREKDARKLLPDWRARSESTTDDHRFIVVFGMDRLLGMSDAVDAANDDMFPETPQAILESLLASAALRGTHLLAWWSTLDTMEQHAGMQAHNLGMRVYLQVPDQRLQLITAGECDHAAAPPLAIWHDVAAGQAAHEFHLYRALSGVAIPDYLKAALQ